MPKSSPLVVLSFVLGLWPAASVNPQTAPPRIIFADSPALLIQIDGDPVYRDVPGTALQRIVNTRPLIVRDQMNGHFLRILDGWMEAYSLADAWSVAGVPPEGGGVAIRQARAAKNVDLLNGGAAQGARRPAGGGANQKLNDADAPAIYISTTPAVLVVTDGPPKFAPIAGTSLEYVANTTANVFREPTDQEIYLLASGQWLRSWTTEGPWQFVPSDQLPADFAKIPATQLKSNR
jgi:hypothetical protein